MPVPTVVGGCASYLDRLHLMRTGAVGVLVGVGPGAACTTLRRARHRCAAGDRDRRRGGSPFQHMLETGEYVNVIGDGGMHRWRHLEGDRLRGRRRDDRFAAGTRQAAPAVATTGAWRPSTRRCRAVPALPPSRTARWRRSCSARPTRTTAPSTDGCPSDLDGDHRLRGHPLVPAGRDDDRSGADDRRQEAPDRAGGRHGKTNGRRVSAESWLLTTESTETGFPSADDRHNGGSTGPRRGPVPQLIARRIRECGVFAELLPASTTVEQIERAPKAWCSQAVRLGL